MLALVVWSVRRAGVRRAGLVLVGALGGAVAVCLPFFLAAPGPMWRMVVLDQLGRRRVAGGVTGRLVDVAGLSQFHGAVSTHALAVVALVVLAVVLVRALRDPLGRLGALLLVVTVAVLLSTPPWSVAYTGLAAPALALLVGSAAPRRHATARVGVVVALLAYAVASLPGLTFGSPFPGRSLERVLASRPGCVTTDDPVALIETGALQRDLTLRCPVVVDLSGYSYDLQPAAGLHVGRPADRQWQRFVLDHLAGGQTAVVVRFRTDPGLSRRTRAEIDGLTLVDVVAGYRVHQPGHLGGPSVR